MNADQHLPSGLAAVCDTPRCPTPDHGNHYHCGRCNSADITSMYGHTTSARGCPTPLPDLPAALRRHLELHDGMSAWPLPPVLDGPVADARLWAARSSLHGPPDVPHTVWAYLGDTLVSYRRTTPEGIADLQAAVDRRTAGDGPAPAARGWADLYLPPGYGDRDDEAFMLLAELVDDGDPPFGASAVAALRRSARTAMRLLAEAGHAGRPDDYGIE